MSAADLFQFQLDLRAGLTRRDVEELERISGMRIGDLSDPYKDTPGKGQLGDDAFMFLVRGNPGDDFSWRIWAFSHDLARIDAPAIQARERALREFLPKIAMRWRESISTTATLPGATQRPETLQSDVTPKRTASTVVLQWLADWRSKTLQGWTVFEEGQPRPLFTSFRQASFAGGRLQGGRSDENAPRSSSDSEVGQRSMEAGNVSITADLESGGENLLLTMRLIRLDDPVVVHVFAHADMKSPLISDSHVLARFELTRSQPEARYRLRVSQGHPLGQLKVISTPTPPLPGQE
jgi:hypothetical protein